MCRCFSVLTSLAAILYIAVNVLSAVRSFKHASDIFDSIFYYYAVIIAAFVVLAETEWSFILNFSKALEYWAVRGMLQILYAFLSIYSQLSYLLPLLSDFNLHIKLCS
ncbi:uncharacterized protein LOC109802686 [Cajanus cajan]|uniref:Uncharacterized protein n=1 Tax=Cajanus cajan TaxID=3821 RepID=A0A151TAR2_CAJCA|nr:uncharacterized protein LOC109802686 [Cajanus cajan]KYP64127.1 hypothetical protein KK1_018716 [Cajanus cajan]KYP64129.1 hypothetical protein KK1_018718 [Cajanus cajan]KYP64130.1 hypothetical protein KK1_018719 [Cajanus cajan]